MTQLRDYTNGKTEMYAISKLGAYAYSKGHLYDSWVEYHNEAGLPIKTGAIEELGEFELIGFEVEQADLRQCPKQMRTVTNTVNL